jgi:hypothetical protein
MQPLDDGRDGNSNLRHLLVQRKIELLDQPVLLRQLRPLEERKTPNSNIDIRPSYSQKDDVAVAVALAAFELTKQLPPLEPWAEFNPRTASPKCPRRFPRTRMDSNQLLRLRLKISESESMREKVSAYY